MMNIRKNLLLLALFGQLIFGQLMLAPAMAQQSLTTDELFEQARALSSDGQRDKARDVCKVILERSPNYVDARVFLGRLYAWDKDYMNARKQLTKALATKPDYLDARLALIDMELWADNPGAALRHAEDGLARSPDEPDLLMRRMAALRDLGRTAEARVAAEQILVINPESERARRTYIGILDETLLNKVSADYAYVTFDDSTDPWHLASVAYRRITGTFMGSVIGRLNLANRFGKSGAQLEVDAYPSLSKFWNKTYAYLNFGVSGSSLFPKTRFGAEVYHNYPRGWEGSAGFRVMNFDSSTTTILTGSVAKYIGNYWISLRPNYVPDSSGDSFSAQLAVRRFFGSRYEYAEFVVGGGIEDEVINFAGETQQLDSFKVKGELRKRIQPDLHLKGSVALRTEEFPYGRERNSIVLGFGVEKYF